MQTHTHDGPGPCAATARRAGRSDVWSSRS